MPGLGFSAKRSSLWWPAAGSARTFLDPSLFIGFAILIGGLRLRAAASNSRLRREHNRGNDALISSLLAGIVAVGWWNSPPAPA